MIKIALAAAQHINRNIPYNLAQLGRFMRRASQAGAQLVCFGEAFLQGFDCLDWAYEADRHMALSAQANRACTRTLMINSICDGDAHGGAFCFENGAITAALKMDSEGLLIVEV